MSCLQIRFAGRYKVEELITRTKLKHIYRARNLQTGELACIKAEFFKAKSNTLLYEGKFYQMTQGCVGIPWMYWCGPESEQCNCLIMEYLGYNVQDLMEMCGGKFSLKTSLMLAEQVLEIIEVYHFKQLIHRNLCPRALQLGKGAKNHLVFLNDLLSSKRYVDSKTGEHLHKRTTVVPEVFNYFNSMNVIKGCEPSRRDDLESWLLMFIYFIKGDLPWLEYSKDNNIETLQLIIQKRQELTWAEICRGLPREVLSMATYISKLQFEEKPDYEYLRKRLRKIAQREEIEFDYVYDWVLTGIAQQQKLECANIQQSPINCEVLPKEDVFLKVFYEPYAKDLELNEVEKKYKSKKLIEQEEEKSMRASELHQAYNMSEVVGSVPDLAINKAKAVPNKRNKQNCTIF